MDDIRNEVDHLIDLLRAEPIHPYKLSALAAQARLSVPQARKWIHILEARGQVKVRYNLTDDEVLWMAKTVQHALGSGGVSSSRHPGAETGGDVQLEVANWNESQFRQTRGAPSGDGEGTPA